MAQRAIRAAIILPHRNTNTQVLHYRRQLALSMQREAQARGEQDALIDAANRRRQAAEDAERAARDGARRRLMAEVDAIRQQQIAEKLAERCARGARAPQLGRSPLLLVALGSCAPRKDRPRRTARGAPPADPPCAESSQRPARLATDSPRVSQAARQAGQGGGTGAGPGH